MAIIPTDNTIPPIKLGPSKCLSLDGSAVGLGGTVVIWVGEVVIGVGFGVVVFWGGDGVVVLGFMVVVDGVVVFGLTVVGILVVVDVDEVVAFVVLGVVGILVVVFGLEVVVSGAGVLPFEGGGVGPVGVAFMEGCMISIGVSFPSVLLRVGTVSLPA